MSGELVTIPPGALAALRAKARAEAELEVWRPEPGEVLEAGIVGHRIANGPFGEGSQLLAMRPDGRRIAIWLTPWLREQFRLQGARAGDLFSLEFLGKGQSAKGATYNRYSLVVLRAAEVRP